LLTREDVQLLVDRLRKTQPSLVGEVIGPDKDVPIGLLQRVLKNLIKDGIPIRELAAILESLGEHASKTKNAVVLTELVRKRLSRTITEQYKNENDEILVITLEPSLEHNMTSTLQQETDGLKLSMPAEMAIEVSRKIAQAWKKAMDEGKDKVVLLCDSRIRSPLAAMLSRTVSLLPVLAYDEIILGTNVEPIDTIVVRQLETSGKNEHELALV
jgi:flagellar biosynthesis protein FlhA